MAAMMTCGKCGKRLPQLMDDNFDLVGESMGTHACGENEYSGVFDVAEIDERKPTGAEAR